MEKMYVITEIAVRFEIPYEEVEQFVNDTIKKHLEEF